MDSELPSSTIFCYPADVKENSNIEVLNVNNVDSSGGAVLNDEKLLELIQLYPFLYNPRVRPFQDPDYDDWAWSRITTAFNANYIGLLPPVLFNKDELQRRWKKLQPIIKKMAKMLDLSAIPEPLRQIIVKISIQLEDQTTDVRVNNLSSAQQIIYDNMDMVEQLPLNKRLQLEAEMMDLILKAELETKATVKLTQTHVKDIVEEYEELLNVMGLKELIGLKSPDVKCTSETKDNAQEQTVTSTTSNGSYEINLTSDSSSDAKYESLNTIDFEVEMGKGAQIFKNCTPKPQWVPLKEASKYLKRCAVRLKRTNMEDYIPLSFIKHQRKST
ncbi:uncharacterized protein LOC101453511 [Ceratitis capitata]|uniref:(Mediterranean fruit fly) hypothetical protein n=1 Tax=Ceratitis capitata TaxID=7213 RepID=W8BVZ5_CERCA|nr:uncharacterized protein LOC101453511 [Ceratitis capitata]CAD7014254.1 unnamed protein product [Ceratitis capitata]